MQKFNHLSPEQRYQIEILNKAGTKQVEIARLIGVHKSTVSRELKRNTGKRGPQAKVYSAKIAMERSKERHQLKRKKIRFTEALKEQARTWLEQDKLSPELIAAQWEKDGQQGVSHETLYYWIWKAKKSRHSDLIQDRGLYKHLRHGKRKQKRGNYRQNRGVIKERVPIDQRPEIVQNRKRLGDVEVDLMMGKNHQSALLVMTDRATLITTMDFLPSKEAELVKAKIKQRIEWIGASWIKTLTFDNDMAFALHHEIRDKYEIKTFFTRPYTSQDKGTVENRIGLIRAFLPKGTDLNEISDKTIAEIEQKINNRPIRKFNYLTPKEKLLSYKAVAFIT
ncbi:MAG: IS30 family transposase [Algoriphagus sp.]|jgi:IS30 family transposase|nr:IS30 family transposase [Algoriphagus sp.]